MPRCDRLRRRHRRRCRRDERLEADLLRAHEGQHHGGGDEADGVARRAPECGIARDEVAPASLVLLALAALDVGIFTQQAVELLTHAAALARAEAEPAEEKEEEKKEAKPKKVKKTKKAGKQKKAEKAKKVAKSKKAAEPKKTKKKAVKSKRK